MVVTYSFKKWIWIIFFIGNLGSWASKSQAQGLSGSNGLFNIPVAYLPDDRQMTMGAHFLNKDYGSFKYGRDKDYLWHGLATFVSIGLLPRVEFQFRYTHLLGREISADERYFPDRMLTFRFQVIKESFYFPALTLGLQDQTYLLGGSAGSFYNTNYLVASKKINILSLSIKTNVGYGFKPIKNNYTPLKSYYKGFFGGLGLSVSDLSGMELLLEYDSRNINVGMKILVFKRLQVLIGLHEGKAFSGGLSWRSRL